MADCDPIPGGDQLPSNTVNGAEGRLECSNGVPKVVKEALHFDLHEASPTGPGNSKGVGPEQARNTSSTSLFGPKRTTRNLQNTPPSGDRLVAPSATQPYMRQDMPPAVDLKAVEMENRDRMFVTPEPEGDYNPSNPYAPGSILPSIERDGTNFIKPEPVEKKFLPTQQRSRPAVITIEDDDDEECMIIDQNDCSEEVRTKWLSSHRKAPIILEDDNPVIKTEPEPPVPTPNFDTAQQRMLQQLNRKRKAGASTIFGPAVKRAGEVNNSSQRNFRRPNCRGAMDDKLDINKELDAVMQHENEDDSWMEQDDEGGSNESEKLNSLLTALEQVQRIRPLTSDELVEILKLKHQIELQERRKEVADRPFIFDREQESMFVSEEEGDMDANKNPEIEGSSNKKKGKKGAKGRTRKPPKNAREVEEKRREAAVRRREKQRERDKKRSLHRAALRAAKNGGRPTAAKAKKAPKGKGKQSHKSRMQNGLEGGSDQTLHNFLADLMHNDFIADRQAQGDLGDALEINETSKKKQLDILFSRYCTRFDRLAVNCLPQQVSRRTMISIEPR
jgi:hypothetical protein